MNKIFWRALGENTVQFSEFHCVRVDRKPCYTSFSQTAVAFLFIFCVLIKLIGTGIEEPLEGLIFQNRQLLNKKAGCI